MIDLIAQATREARGMGSWKPTDWVIFLGALGGFVTVLGGVIAKILLAKIGKNTQNITDLAKATKDVATTRLGDPMLNLDPRANTIGTLNRISGTGNGDKPVPPIDLTKSISDEFDKQP